MNTSDRFESPVRPKAIPAATEALSAVAERMGKIAQAVVLIAAAVPDRNQLLHRTVDSTVDTLSHIHRLEAIPELATVADVQTTDVTIRHSIQAIELCHIAGLVSDMNASIIKSELEATRKFLQEKLITYCIGQVTYPFRVPEITSESSQTSISVERYFAPREGLEKKISPATISESTHKTSPETSFKKTFSRPESAVVKSPFQELREKPHLPEPRPSVHVTVKPVSGEDKKERRDAIMRTIRSKGQVTIKDIAENIRGCSEKTIQRDLQELIQHGVLIREGEKRWAVYKLAMNNA